MLRYVKNGMLLLSVAYIVIGMLLLIMPETSLLWICNIFGVVVLEGTALLPIDGDGRNGQARRLGSQQDGGARAADGQRQGHDESRHSLSHAAVGPLCGCIIRNR